MKRNRNKVILVLLIFGLLLSSSSFSDSQEERGRREERTARAGEDQTRQEGRLAYPWAERYASRQVLVKFRPDLTPESVEVLLKAYRSEKLARIEGLNLYQVVIPDHLTVEETVYALAQNPNVEYVEPNYIRRIAITPNDALFRYQYALENSGQEIGIPGAPRGRAGADINAPQAWEETKGTDATVIAIIDTGIDLLHPDIQNKIYSSGWDFVNNDNDATDDHGHGTHVAGIVAADTNNSEGIAGVAWNCKLLPLKVFDKNGWGYDFWVIAAIIYAVDNGADVLNLSLGGEETSEGERDAVRYAYEHGVVIAAAAGNTGGPVLYPAAYDEYCLAVAATDYDDARTSWSNFGPQVDVAAPGDRVVSLVPTWYFGPDSFPYGFGGGTSASTAHVAGLAALLKDLKPWLTVQQIMDVIRFSADDVNAGEHAGRDDYIGYGRINMEKALVPIKISD